jgi:hypothetical protein
MHRREWARRRCEMNNSSEGQFLHNRAPMLDARHGAWITSAGNLNELDASLCQIFRYRKNQPILLIPLGTTAKNSPFIAL